MKIGDWGEIFRTGNYGTKGIFTREDLDAIVKNFNGEDKAPIVVGHPKTDSPAWGWLDGLKRSGDVLLGKVGSLHTDFQQAIAEKKFRNRSVRIARTEAGPKLLHLGFLGATLPHVEGLKQTAQFAESEVCVDFGFDLADRPGDNREEHDMDKDQQIKDLEKKLADEQAARKQEKDASFAREMAQRKSDFAGFVENQMIATGKLPKERKDEAVAFMMSLPAGESAEFSWGEGDEKKKSTGVQWFKDFVGGIASAEFTRGLPAGETQDFSQGGEELKLTDLSKHV